MWRVVWKVLVMGGGSGWRGQRASGAKWCLRGWPLVSWLPWLHSVSREGLAPLLFNRARRVTEQGQSGHGDKAARQTDRTRAGYSMDSGRASAEGVQQRRRRPERAVRAVGACIVAWQAGRCRRRKARDALGMGGEGMGWDGRRGDRGATDASSPAMVGSLPHCSLFGLLDKASNPACCSRRVWMHQ